MNQTANPTAADWHARAATLAINGQAFIDGRYVAAASGETFDDVTPIDGRVIARVASTDKADVNRAVAAARRAFDKGVWAHQPPRERKRVLQRFAELILAHTDELALLETLDMGKPISDSLAVDIPATARCIAWYAEAVDKVYDEVAPTAHDQLALITREPIGVVAAIVPWNFPLIMAAWKIGPALAAGNSFILKPSEKSPLTCDPARSARGRGRPAGRCVQRIARLRPHRGPGAGAAHGRRLHRVHRLDAYRQADAAVLGPVEHEARMARVRRQVARTSSWPIARTSTVPRRLRPARSSSTRARCALRPRG